MPFSDGIELFRVKQSAKLVSVRSGGTILKFAFLLLLAFVQPVVSQTGAVDPRIGSWTLISAQSTLNPTNKLSIVDSSGAVHVVMSGESHLDFIAKSGGRATPVTGNPAFDQVELRRIDKRQSEVTEKKGGAVVATVRVKLSADKNMLTVTTVSLDRPNQITVWARSGAAKPGGDPLAGEWTQDLNKTRLQQGLVLKIQPDANAAVRFTGDYSYTARFDGKPYDLKNSRNDTITLQLVDPHTVDAIYRRDDQVTQKDRWTVSPDGQQMTVTTTGTLATGQQLNEKLAFKKQ
jgi:hypothetical protein